MKLFIGLAWIAIVAWITYLVSHDTGYTLIAICAALVVLPPSYDPAIIWKEAMYRPPVPPATPSCFGGFAHYNPNITAERDCECCPFIQDCIEETPFRHTGESP